MNERIGTNEITALKKSFPLARLGGALGAAALIFTLSSPAQSGGPFSLAWSTIDGGGGLSSGGQFTLQGTIGQPDASPSAGGNFKLEGGFWSGVSLWQTPGAPTLKIKLIPGGLAVLSWPVSASGFTLEYRSSLSSGQWSAAANPVADTATEHTVTVPAAGVMKCYRLAHP
jgi:hypothetical protein